MKKIVWVFFIAPFSLQGNWFTNILFSLREKSVLYKSPIYRTMEEAQKTDQKFLSKISHSPEETSKAIEKWCKKHTFKYPSLIQKSASKGIYSFLGSVIYHIIKNEAQYPHYRSFFHGTSTQLLPFLTLQKKLYERYYGDTPKDMDFLRAFGSRSDLYKVNVTNYKHMDKDDRYEPKRTHVLSVSYFPWEHAPLYMGRSTVPLYIEKWLKMSLDTFGLTASPEDLEKTVIPSSHKMLFFHLQLGKKETKKLVYDSKDLGLPTGKEIPQNSCYRKITDDEACSFKYMARILLTPIFDHPHRGIKIHTYHDLTKEEIDQIDRSCEDLLDRAGAFFWNKRDTLRKVFDEMHFDSH